MLEAVGDAMAATRAIRQLIQGGFDLTDADTVAMKCKYLDDEGDLCTLNKLTLATLEEAARHIEGEAGKQDATASNDVDCDEGKRKGTVIRYIDCHDAPKPSAIEVVDWTRAAYGRCPRHRKHTRHRTNNSGGLVRNTVSEYDGPKLGNEVKAEEHEVRRDKVKVDQLADLSGTMDVERPGPVISCINNS